MSKNKNEVGKIYFASDRKRLARAFVFVIADILSVVIASVAALWIRFDFSFRFISREHVYLNNALKMLPFDILSLLIIFTSF